MSDYNIDDKPKNDFDRYGNKSKNDYHYSAKPERGGCLTFFLGFLAFGNLILVMYLVNVWVELQNRVIYSSPYAIIPARTNPMNYVIIGLAIIGSFLAFVCVYGLWNWKSWGYQGLMGLYALGILIGIFIFLSTWNISSGVGSAVGMGVLYYLMKDKMNYLE